jgi:drug/metabolite transporter (DMT)-like permease
MIPIRAGFWPRAAALGAVLLWGISFVATKAALQEISPVTLIFSRFAMGTAILFLILKFRGESFVPPREALPSLALMGFVGIFIHQMLQAYGLTMTTAIRAGWLIGLIPIWSAVLSTIFLGERFNLRKAAGLILGTVGAVLVITRGEISSRFLALPTTMGDLLVLASTWNWAIYTILGRKTLKQVGSAKATAVAMFIGWTLFIPFFLRNAAWHEYAFVSGKGLAAILFLGIGCSGIGYLFWYAALERVEPSQVAAFLHVEPLVTLIAAVIVLGETVAISTVVGGVLVLTGVATVQRG